MNYHNITECDIANGEGIRTVLWVAGCGHHCPGCHNPQTWDPNGGVLFDKDAEERLMRALSPAYISGITFSGGDPLHEANRYEVGTLVLKIKELFPDKTIWIYTGYSWEEVKDLLAVKYADVLVDGRFQIAKRDISLYWRGSSNQRVIDIPKSIQSGAVCLREGT